MVALPKRLHYADLHSCSMEFHHSDVTSILLSVRVLGTRLRSQTENMVTIAEVPPAKVYI